MIASDGDCRSAPLATIEEASAVLREHVQSQLMLPGSGAKSSVSKARSPSAGSRVIYPGGDDSWVHELKKELRKKGTCSHSLSEASLKNYGSVPGTGTSTRRSSAASVYSSFSASSRRSRRPRTSDYHNIWGPSRIQSDESEEDDPVELSACGISLSLKPRTAKTPRPTPASSVVSTPRASMYMDRGTFNIPRRRSTRGSRKSEGGVDARSQARRSTKQRANNTLKTDELDSQTPESPLSAALSWVSSPISHITGGGSEDRPPKTEEAPVQDCLSDRTASGDEEYNAWGSKDSKDDMQLRLLAFEKARELQKTRHRRMKTLASTRSTRPKG
eukprot:TRINITY_DN10561_c0_g1_i1.p1 TRINITY_DN10561_c0_g1~~TRINITY_DN10561_c0_g1_i1.p1  ORF type:complete len:331 (-),score=16.26 TRINITY_DN10561_c0_g1_i1:664-1656(-)